MALPTTAYALATAQSSPSATVTDFSLFVDLSLLPSTWWDEVDTTDGTRGRVALDDETELACCWIDFDDTAETGYVWFQVTGDITNSDTPAVRIYPPKAANSAVAASATYGSDNAFNSDWGGFWTLSDLTDRTGNGNSLTAYNAPTSGVSGKFGDCYGFAAASSQRLAASVNSAAMDQRTLIVWGNLSGEGGQNRNIAMCNGSSSNATHLRVGYRGQSTIDDPESTYADPSSSDSNPISGPLSTGVWHHFAATLDLTANTLTMRLDGGTVSTQTCNRLDYNTDLVTFGSLDANAAQSNFWEGDIAWGQLHTVDRGAAWTGYDYTISNDNSAFWGSWTLAGGSTPIVAGSLSVTSETESAIGISTTAATGGDASLTYQLQRSGNTGAALSWSNIGSAQAGLTWTDSTVSADTAYLYRVLVTDGTQNEYTATIAADAEDKLAVARRLYSGKPTITGLSSITAEIIANRLSGAQPAALHVSGCESSFDAGEYADFDYRWDFGDSSGTETMTEHKSGNTVNVNTSQRGPEAAYLYRDTGTYTVTLTVSGRDENGLLISDSTTTLVTRAHWSLCLGDATGGTFTLTYNSNTTAAIAYDATDSAIETALFTLADLDATNCRVYNGSITLFGDLSGSATAITGNFASLTGGSAGTAPSLRNDVVADTSSTFSVTSISGWSEIFVDPDYDGSNGASDGTETRPYTAWSSAETFLEAASDRIVNVKRGTSTTVSNPVTWEEYNGHRIRAYGSGADPILTGFGTYFRWRCVYGQAEPMGDTVFSNISIEQVGNGTAFEAVHLANGSTADQYGTCLPVVLDNVSFTTTGTGTARPVSFSQAGSFGAFGCTGLLVWQPDFDHVDGEKSGIFCTLQHWFACLGGSIRNGRGSEIFDHHIYCNTKRNVSIQYLEGNGDNDNTSKNFFVNTNCSPDTGVINEFFNFASNDATGTMNCFSFANSNNSSNPTDGYFRKVVVADNRIHSGQLTNSLPDNLGQQHGIYTVNITDMTVRDNLFWDNGSHNIRSSDAAHNCDMSLYRNWVYGKPLVAIDEDDGYAHHNIIHATTGQAAMRYDADATIATWDIDFNQLWAPDSTDVVLDDTGTTWESFATWQGLGNDANGSEADPGWYDPANGDFSQVGDNPTVQSATINTAGTQYTIVFSENVTGQTGFTISPSGGAATLTPLSGDGTDTHVWTISRTISKSETVTRSYTPGTAQDDAGNLLDAFSGEAVTNGSGYPPPSVTSAAIVVSGDELSLMFTESVTGQLGWELTATDGAVTATGTHGDGTESHSFSLSRVIGNHETVTLAYNTGTGNAVDDDGLEVEAFSGADVDNDSTQDTVDPEMVRAQISVDRNAIELLFSENVTGQTAFTLTASGGAVTLSAPTGDGTATFTFALSRTIASDETVTLSYDSVTGTSVDDTGNALQDITDAPVAVGSGAENLLLLGVG